MLIQQNVEGCERSKGKKTEKRIKTSEEEYKVVTPRGKDINNGKSIENASPPFQNKLIRERDELAYKLTMIEQIVLSTKESDAVILKKIRDFIRSMNQPEDSPNLNYSMNFLDQSLEGLSTIEKSSSKRDTALLIDGESI